MINQNKSSKICNEPNIGVSPIIREAVHSVYNQLGFGLSESSYRKALTKELSCFYDHIEEEYAVPIYFVTSKGQRFQITTLKCDIIIKLGAEITVLELKTGLSELKPICKEQLQIERYKKLLNARESFLINFHRCGFQIL